MGTQPSTLIGAQSSILIDTLCSTSNARSLKPDQHTSLFTTVALAQPHDMQIRIGTQLSILIEDLLCPPRNPNPNQRAEPKWTSCSLILILIVAQLCAALNPNRHAGLNPNPQAQQLRPTRQPQT